jgi:carbonic anhydrase/acetyltransferase-like protein (isoleucine patch superfamily)
LKKFSTQRRRDARETLNKVIYEFDGFIPVIHETSFVHPLAAVTGNVIIGRNVYIGPGAAVRGDWGEIIIEDGCNVQENCTIHMFPGMTVLLKEGAHMVTVPLCMAQLSG